jgi:hypothetical protein
MHKKDKDHSDKDASLERDFGDDREHISDKDANRDPITGEPGAHPVGTGLGTAGGAATGAAVGAVGGPVGAAIGMVAGGLAGAFAGKGIAEKINPTEEDAYWSKTYETRPYREPDRSYEYYQPAYRYGWESYGRHAETGRSFDELEPDLSRDWETYRGDSDLDWDRARPAVRDAWHRVERALPGDADKDGR